MRVFKLIVLLIFTTNITLSQTKEVLVKQLLDNWHHAASIADFDQYFKYMSEESIYIGTDATERWSKEEFKAFAKPYFDQGKAWDFKALERKISFSTDGNVAWIDELLETHMNICRGSGVLLLEHGKWHIVHYVLSMTIPNDVINDVLPFKAPIENKLIDSLNKKDK